jgi:hypothetical protein
MLMSFKQNQLSTSCTTLDWDGFFYTTPESLIVPPVRGNTFKTFLTTKTLFHNTNL